MLRRHKCEPCEGRGSFYAPCVADDREDCGECDGQGCIWICWQCGQRFEEHDVRALCDVRTYETPRCLLCECEHEPAELARDLILPALAWANRTLTKGQSNAA